MHRLSLVVATGGYSLAVELWLLVAVDSVVAEYGIRTQAGSLFVAHRLSCPTACGLFLNQGWNSCPLH